MDKCPLCSNGRLVTKLSKAGKETYCNGCRNIIASATLGFIFTANGDEGIQDCMGPDTDPRPGFKGPGKKAKCYLYDEGNEESKKDAQERARNSAYSSQRQKAASKIVNSNSFFELNDPGYNLIGEDRSTRELPILRSDGGNANAQRARSGPARDESALGDAAPTIQIDDINHNQLGVAASVRLANLIVSFAKEKTDNEADEPIEEFTPQAFQEDNITDYMGTDYSTNGI